MNRFKMLRKARGLTQEQLAKQLGVTRSTVSMWEIDKSRPKFDMILKLIDVLGCSAEALIRKKPDAREKQARIIELFGKLEENERAYEIIEKAITEKINEVRREPV